MNKASHFAVIEKLNSQTTARFGDALLATSSKAVELKEHFDGKEYPPVIYFPRESVEMKYFQKVEGFHTRCPIKGSATYYKFVVNDHVVENAAWSYENPLPDSNQIKGYISFDKSKLDVEISTE